MNEVIVIGGGFYGLRIALYLRVQIGVPHVTVLEREGESMTRASLVNQARVHNGYHYPRSILTAFRSRINFPRFVDEYHEAVVDDFAHYYAISSRNSKVNGRQFELFCLRIGAEFEVASSEATGLFDQRSVDGVYSVREYGFDSHILRSLLLDRIGDVGHIDVLTGHEVSGVERVDGGIRVRASDGDFVASRVINATYSRLNEINRASGLETFELQQEVAEMALVNLPSRLKSSAFTVMDGPFFSMMPYPTRNAHTLSHVRYTPHNRWRDGSLGTTSADLDVTLNRARESSTYRRMRADVLRYLPVFEDAEYVDSIFEVKTVPTRSGDNDSRPILFKSDVGIPGYSCVLGGKLDNIYDVFKELDLLYA